MPKMGGAKKGPSVMGKGPGDFTQKPKVPKYRGEDGYGGDSNSSKKETSSVNIR